jgi:hypothetical protein
MSNGTNSVLKQVVSLNFIWIKSSQIPVVLMFLSRGTFWYIFSFWITQATDYIPILARL